MRPLKKIIHSEIIQNFFAFLCASYLRIVFFLSRFYKVGFEIPAEYVKTGKPFITCFWHNRLMMLPYAWDHERPFHMLISSHSDGKLISKTVSYFNILTISGSSKRHGAIALKKMVSILKKGGTVGITPDGPKGPREIVKPGVIQASYLSRADILPVCYSVSAYKIFSSWDRFILPLPSRRGALIWGNPIPAPTMGDDASIEKVRRDVERALIDLAKKADEEVSKHS